MNFQQPFAHYLASASPVVQIVILILVIASVISWTIIFQRWFALGRAMRLAKRFEKKFWKEPDMDVFLTELEKKPKKIEGLSAIFRDGYKELLEVSHELNLTVAEKMEAIKRVMRISANNEEEDLESNLSWLATIGSVSPYIGLFGTVWGIMMSFHSLGGAQQVTIAMVAPGISEALIATALGLFAAIPAVIFYNRYTNIVDKVLNRYDAFQQEFENLLARRLRQKKPAQPASGDANE